MWRYTGNGVSNQCIVWPYCRISEPSLCISWMSLSHTINLLPILVLARNGLYVGRMWWWDHLEQCKVFTFPTLPVLIYCWNPVLEYRIRADVMWHVVSLEWATLVLVRYSCPVVRGLIMFQCCHTRMGWRSCRVLILKASGVPPHFDHYAFAFFFVSCTYDSAVPIWLIGAPWRRTGNL